MTTLFRFLLLATLASNAVLGWIVFSGANHSTTPSSSAVARVSLSAAPAASAKIDPDVWPSLFTDDLPTLVSRLRAAGFPPDMVRAIAAGQINERYAAKRRALDADSDSRPFWKTRAPDAKLDLASFQLNRDQQKELRDLLGDDVDSNDAWTSYNKARQTAGLSLEKAAEVRHLAREFDDRRGELYASGATSMAERQKVDQAQHAALAQILTPAEMMDYDLRNSETAQSMRSSLNTFDPTEAEFRAIFPLQRAFDDQYSFRNGPPSQEDMQMRVTAEKAMKAQIEAMMTPDRAAEYERNTDYSYRQTALLVDRLQLPPETTLQLSDVQKDVQSRRNALYQDRTLTADQRTQQLDALSTEATTALTTKLGQSGFEAYKQYGGQWLQSLKPRPTKARP